MNLNEIVQELRASNIARYNNRIGGALELQLVQENTYNIESEALFVMPLGSVGTANEQTSGVQQIISERFAVIVALKNDTRQGDETGSTSYDIVDTARAEIFKSILGYDTTDIETPVYFVGGKIIGLNRGFLWYQFEFEYKHLIHRIYDPTENDTGDGKSFDISQYPSFDKIWTDIIMSPSVKLANAAGKDLPLDSADVDQQMYQDLSINPNDGSFSISFASGFNYDKV